MPSQFWQSHTEFLKCPYLFVINYLLFFTLIVGASVDPAGVTMVDSIKIYGKTKEQFGWPDEPPEDFPSASVNNVVAPSVSQSNTTGEVDSVTPSSTSGSVLER